MYRILSKKSLNYNVTQMEIDAPLVATKAKPGQFIILRVDQGGERIPLTVAGIDKEKGSVKIVFKVAGSTTQILHYKEAGDSLCDFAIHIHLKIISQILNITKIKKIMKFQIKRCIL